MMKHRRLILLLLGLAGAWLAIGLTGDGGEAPPRQRVAPLGEAEPLDSEGTASAGPVAPAARPRGTARRGGADATSPVSADQLPELDLVALERPAQAIELGRDPWRYGDPPRPAYTVPPPRPAPVQPVVPVQTSYEPPRPQPPPLDLSYLGSFGPPDRRIAVLVDQQQVIYNALRGEVIKGKFRVHDIGYESVDIAFEGFPEVPPKRLSVGGG